VPPSQNPLRQSPPHSQEPPALTGAQVPLSQNWLQQSPPFTHPTPTCAHDTVVEVVDDEVDEDVLDDVDELVDEDVVVVVALMQAAELLSDDGEGHPVEHAAPAGQHVRLTPLPHGVVPDGHPQKLCAAEMQATPLLQHLVPHGVWPFSQQHPDGSEHVPPLGQQPSPHAGEPAGQVTAPPRRGRKIVAATAATPLAPRTLSAPRREVEPAIARDSSSNDRFTAVLPRA
jgi:hypothetical protein